MMESPMRFTIIFSFLDFPSKQQCCYYYTGLISVTKQECYPMRFMILPAKNI